jgi:hypothetical protein
MDLTSLRLRIRDRLQPSNITAAFKSAFAAVRLLYFRAWRRWNKPGFKSGLFLTIGWALIASLYGLLVGAATVLLPPMAPVALVAVSAPVLFWALPDLPTIPAATLRRVFFITVVIELGIPTYYMVQISGFPWISIRRLAVFSLILLTLYSISVSRDERRTVSSALSEQRWLGVCIIGFLVMSFISLFTTAEPTMAFTQFIEMFLNWYLPFFACLLVVRSEKDVILLCKTVALVFLFVGALGMVDFFTHHTWALDVIPKPLLSKMMADNPSVAVIVNASPFRNGQYRASSIYNVSLSFGECACMVAPIGLYFIFHGRQATDRLIGVLLSIVCVGGIFVSGSRGGSIAFVISAPLFLGLWVVRYAYTHPRSVLGAVFATVAGMGIASVFALILTWKKLSNIVLGGGDAASSDQSRHEQWALGIPHILANPITGHGFGTAGEVVNWHAPGGGLSIDSYALNLLVETGVPGFVLYFGMVLVAAGVLIRVYLKDRDPAAEIGAPIACSLIAYGIYRLVLSQRENQTLAFILLAAALVVAQESAKRLSKKPHDVAPRNSGAPLAPNVLRTSSAANRMSSKIGANGRQQF